MGVMSQLAIDSDPQGKMNELQHQHLCDEIHDLYCRKNHDYGDSFYRQIVEDGIVVAKIRLEDKFNRFKKLLHSDAQVKDESLRDTLVDLANYAMMTVMALDKQTSPIDWDQMAKDVQNRHVKNIDLTPQPGVTV